MEHENKDIIDKTDEVKTKPAPLIKLSGIIPYLRELSIVIIGILITVGITSFISNHNRQKEINGMLRLVKEELKENRQNFRGIRARYEAEQHAFRLLRENLNDITQISADTLENYKFAIGNIYQFETRRDSYDVLKNSVLVQYIKEKDLKYQLSRIYRLFDSLDEQLVRYSAQKSAAFNSVVYGMDNEEVEAWANGDDIYKFFKHPVEHKAFRTFIIIGGTIFSPDFLDNLDERLSAIINNMEEYGY